MNGIEMVGTQWERTTARGRKRVTVVEYSHDGMPPFRAPATTLFSGEECIRVREGRRGGDVWKLDHFLRFWERA